jgi:GTP-dependent phosphoenolpyruvate carboxykinase
MAELLAVNHDDWRAEVPLIREHLAQFKSRTPERLNQLVNELESALK